MLTYSTCTSAKNNYWFSIGKKILHQAPTLNISKSRHPTDSLSRKTQDQLVLIGSVQLVCTSVYFSLIRLHKIFTLSPVIRKTTVLTWSVHSSSSCLQLFSFFLYSKVINSCIIVLTQKFRRLVHLSLLLLHLFSERFHGFSSLFLVFFFLSRMILSFYLEAKILFHFEFFQLFFTEV